MKVEAIVAEHDDDDEEEEEGYDYRGTTKSAKSASDLAGLLGNGQGICFGGYDVTKVSFKRYYQVSEDEEEG